MMKAYKTKNAGFTLLEVLVALVVLSLAFTATYSSLNSVSRNLFRMQDKTAAAWVGMNVIAKAQLDLLALPTSGYTTGRETMFDSDWSWKLTISPTENKTVSEIMVEVSREKSENSLIQLTGYLRKKKTL